MVQNEQGVFQITRETRENWERQNPILPEGVLGYETDTNILRVGNGRNRFADLPGLGNAGDFAPALHAAQHAVGGADPITPASLNVVARETSNPAWISMPLLNDFTGEVLCMKDAYGWVHVKGSVTRSAVPPASTRLFELPVGYRPARWFSGLLTQTGADNTLWATGMIISISGGVETSSFTPPSNFSTTRSIYLVGAVFKASL